jgi:hypothetical protein
LAVLCGGVEVGDRSHPELAGQASAGSETASFTYATAGCV